LPFFLVFFSGFWFLCFYVDRPACGRFLSSRVVVTPTPPFLFFFFFSLKNPPQLGPPFVLKNPPNPLFLGSEIFCWVLGYLWGGPPGVIREYFYPKFGLGPPPPPPPPLWADRRLFLFFIFFGSGGLTMVFFFSWGLLWDGGGVAPRQRGENHLFLFWWFF